MKIKTKNASLLALAVVLLGVVWFLGVKFRSYFMKAKSTPLPTVANISVIAPQAAQPAQPVPTKHAFLGDQVIRMQEDRDYPLTPPAGAVYAQFQVQINQVLVRFGGSPAAGGFLCETEELHTLENAEEINRAIFRSKTGEALLVVNYFSAA